MAQFNYEAILYDSFYDLQIGIKEAGLKGKEIITICFVHNTYVVIFNSSNGDNK